MITLYNSCVRKFIYLQNFQTFTIYRNSSCSYPWKKVWWYTSINQSPCYSSQYKRVLEDTDCGKRYRNKTPCICSSKAQWPLGIKQAFWNNLCIFYHWDTKVNSLDFWCLVHIYANFYPKMWSTFKTHLWGSEQIKMASTKAEKLITLNHN